MIFSDRAIWSRFNVAFAGAKERRANKPTETNTRCRNTAKLNRLCLWIYNAGKSYTNWFEINVQSLLFIQIGSWLYTNAKCFFKKKTFVRCSCWLCISLRIESASSSLYNERSGRNVCSVPVLWLFYFHLLRFKESDFSTGPSAVSARIYSNLL